MKIIKVSIQDANTLVLQEDAQKGDLIDLKSLHDIDIDKSTIDGVVMSIKRDVFNKQVQKERETIERESKLREKLREQEIIELSKEDINKKDIEIAKLKSQKDSELVTLASQKDAELIKLKAKIESAEVEKTLAVTEAVTKVEKERDNLATELKIKDSENLKIEISLKEKHAAEIKAKDEIIERYKDMKVKLSTKMLGETLEQHCEIEFNRLRATGFQNSYFEKDNNVKDGSKGDYIYRETDEAGIEILSVMFDMKNEQDQTTSKKKNEDFLKELDKDRNEKKCEYAILVSMLESDNELYNTGIVDVSYRYPKMYVIRPQFFIPIITLLRNAALGSMKYKAELAFVRSQNIDITNFESELQLFQDGFMKNVKDSSGKFQEAMDGIDATIKKLEGIKEALRLSNKHLLTAGNKVETVSVKRLTKENPTMMAKFAELKDDRKVE